MGQFQSKEYDGDPYVDLMRALPERELIWWVQKAIWLVEGFTFLDHFGRTYPNLFIHKCKSCNGAGSVTCPHCHGYKLKQGTGGTAALRFTSGLSGKSLVQSGRAADAVECQHCGGYCDWDHESEWEEKWMNWESKLAYYDRTYGQLMDEWYEDVLHEGNLDEDTPHEDGPPPAPEEKGPIAEYDRQKQKYPQLLQALMQRYGGHPYETRDMLPYNIVDPVKKSPFRNLWALGHNRMELPQELHPYNFPELLLLPTSPLTEHDHQIRMEALLCRNLDAALQDEAKPYQFEPTAGTVPCPGCLGKPYSASIVPNLEKMFHLEVPMWQRVLGRMDRWATQPRRLPDAESRHFLEYPQKDPAVTTLEAEVAAAADGPPGPEQKKGSKRRAVKKGARASLVGGQDLPEDPRYIQDWGMRGLAVDTATTAGAEDKQASSQGGVERGQAGSVLLVGDWRPSSGPGRAAALLRDIRKLKQVQGTAAEQEVLQQLQQSYSPAALQAMMALSSSSNSNGSNRSRQASLVEAAAVAELPSKFR